MSLAMVAVCALATSPEHHHRPDFAREAYWPLICPEVWPQTPALSPPSLIRYLKPINLTLVSIQFANSPPVMRPTAAM